MWKISTVFAVPENSFKKGHYLCEKWYKIATNRPISKKVGLPNSLEFMIFKILRFFKFGSFLQISSWNGWQVDMFLKNEL